MDRKKRTGVKIFMLIMITRSNATSGYYSSLLRLMCAQKEEGEIFKNIEKNFCGPNPQGPVRTPG